MSDHLIAEANRHAKALPCARIKYDDLVREVRKLGSRIPCATGGTFEHDPLDAILDAAYRETRDLRSEVERLNRILNNSVARPVFEATCARLTDAKQRAERAEAALRGLVSAVDAVLCDPEGRCVFQGADADRYHVQAYLDAARAAKEETKP